MNVRGNEPTGSISERGCITAQIKNFFAFSQLVDVKDGEYPLDFFSKTTNDPWHLSVPLDIVDDVIVALNMSRQILRSVFVDDTLEDDSKYVNRELLSLVGIDDDMSIDDRLSLVRTDMKNCVLVSSSNPMSRVVSCSYPC